MTPPLTYHKSSKRLDWLQRAKHRAATECSKPPSHNHTKSQFKATHAHTAHSPYANCFANTSAATDLHYANIGYLSIIPVGEMTDAIGID